MGLIGLISCVSAKQNFPSVAKNLYISPLFINSKKYAEKRLDKYFILSAKYGLLEPSDFIEPYEETLNNKSKQERLEWANKVFQKLDLKIEKNDRIVFLAGEKYREFLEEKLKEKNIYFQTPLNKYSIG